jgi:hypothetical protein
VRPCWLAAPPGFAGTAARSAPTMRVRDAGYTDWRCGLSRRAGGKTRATCIPTFSNMVSQEVVTDINVLGARVLNRVVSNFYGTLIVTKERNPI